MRAQLVIYENFVIWKSIVLQKKDEESKGIEDKKMVLPAGMKERTRSRDGQGEEAEGEEEGSEEEDEAEEEEDTKLQEVRTT